MARFLTPAWADAFNAALEGVVLPGPGPEAGLAAADGCFTVLEEVRGTPDGDVHLSLRFDNGGLQLGVEAAGVGRERENNEVTPEVTIKVTYEDAAAMSKGELAPADALNAGRIRVRGDLSVLVAAQQLLAAARTATRVLDSTTTY
jgi:putative sterol carrier protein